MPRVDLIRKDEAMKKGDAEGYYIIRRLLPDVGREIRERHTQRIEPDTPGGIPREETDWAAVEIDQLDYVIQDWLVHDDNVPAACTLANKKALPLSERQMVLLAAGARNLRGELSTPLEPWKEPSEPPGPAGASMSLGLTERTAAPSERIGS